MKNFKKIHIILLMVGLIALIAIAYRTRPEGLRAFEMNSDYKLTALSQSAEVGETIELTLDVPVENQGSLILKTEGAEDLNAEIVESAALENPDVTFSDTSDGNGVAIKPEKKNTPINISLDVPASQVGETVFSLYKENNVKVDEVKVNVEEKQAEDDQLVTASSNIEKIKPLSIALYSTESVVDSWDGFVKALADPEVSIIRLKNNIQNTGTATAGTIERSVVIIGDGFLLDFGNVTGPCITLSNNVSVASTLKLQNISVTSRGSDTADNSIIATPSNSPNENWTVEFTDFVNDPANNKRLVRNTNGAILFSGGTNTLNSNKTTGAATGAPTSILANWYRFFEAKNLRVTNGAVINADIQDMFMSSNVANAYFLVDSGSKMKIRNQKTPILAIDNANAVMRFTDTDTECTFSTGTVYTDRFGGGVCVQGNNALIDVDKQAKLNIHGDNRPATIMQSSGGNFNVHNNSKLYATQDTDTGYTYGAVVRFRVSGNMTFTISDNSVFHIEKKSGTGGPAVRMSGSNNIINVNTASRFYMINNSQNEGIEYAAGGNQFNLKGANSKVQIYSAADAAITSGTINILGEKGTEFTVDGAGTSAFRYGSGSQFEFNNMLYYDFRNHSNRQVFDGTATLKSVNSDASVWLSTVNDLEGDPSQAWTLMNMGLSGSRLNTVSTNFTMSLLDSVTGQSFTTDPDVRTFLSASATRMERISRLSGNNANPIVDELRVPTNADKYIYGHVTVPEGVEGARDAWTDEVTVKVQVKKKNGSTYELMGKTGTFAVYEAATRDGVFRIANKDGEFLQEGDQITVLEAWRGGVDNEANPTESKVHIGKPEDDERWVKSPVTTEDVTPPTSLKVTTKEITNATKQIKGTVDLYDEHDDKLQAEVNLFVKLNGTFLKDSSGNLITTKVTTTSSGEGTVKDWVINLPKYLDKNDQIDIYVKDNTVLKVDNEQRTLVKNPPVTYTTEPDGQAGNISTSGPDYDSYKGYHDAVQNGDQDDRFKPSIFFTVKDVLPDKPVVTKTVVSDTAGNITQVGSTLTYTVTLKNDKPENSKATWYDTYMSDTLPAGLDYDPAKADVSVKINDTILTNSTINYNENTRELKVEVGNIEPQETATITFKVKVNREAVSQTVTNTAWGIGKSPQEVPFNPGPLNPDADHVIEKASDSVKNPGDSIMGMLELASAPKVVDFGTVNILEYQKKINVKKPNDPDQALVVEDSRGVPSSWKLTARLTKEMTNTSNPAQILRNAVRYTYKGNETVLSSAETIVFQSDSEPLPGRYSISDSWSENDDGDGLKFRLPTNNVPASGSYQGEITWQIKNTQD